MNKDKARELLEKYFAWGGIPPIFDCVVHREIDRPNGIQRDYTFRHLLCIAYDLQENEKST